MTIHIKFILIIILTSSIKVCNAQQTVSSLIKDIIEYSRFSDGDIQVAERRIYSQQELILFYQSTGYEQAWMSDNISAMIEAIRRAEEEGLTPSDYHLHNLELYNGMDRRSEVDNTYFDVLLTDAFLTYGNHLLSGKLDPTKLYPEKWEYNKRTGDLVTLLRKALLSFSISEALEELKPTLTGYKQLKNRLKFFKNISNNESWTLIPEGNSLEPLMSDERVSLIRRRLIINNYFVDSVFLDSLWYDSSMVLAIKKFQYDRGLHSDGIIGKQTLAFLNFSPEDYMNKIRVNLERYRWVPDSLGEMCVVVNIPSFKLGVYKSDSLILSENVIVGRSERTTPIFSSSIKYLIINPTWTVPPTILKEDFLPAVKKDIRFLKKNNLHVINREGSELYADSLPWSTYTFKNFPYQLVQDPGQYNSLGLIKFQFPNHYKVFLHDTNAPSLFGKSYRALSSGCIRLQNPFSLAMLLLKDSKWSKKKLDKIVSSGKTTTIVIPHEVPIHILYFTAFVDENTFQVRDDIYDMDQIVLDQLDRPGN